VIVRRGPSAPLRLLAGLLVTAAALVAVVALPVGAAPAGPTQATTTTVAPDDPAATEPPAATDPAADAPPTGEAPASTMPSTTTPALEDRATESDQATTRLNWVVIGLLALAAVIAVATVFFWYRTRPSRAGKGAAKGSGRAGRPARTGAVVVAADGTEQRLVDPGPAAFAHGDDDEDLGPRTDDPENDPWAVRPAPRLPQRDPGAAPGPGAQPVSARRPISSEPPPSGASEPGTWWASQDLDQPDGG
jgi:hypothetical protein